MGRARVQLARDYCITGILSYTDLINYQEKHNRPIYLTEKDLEYNVDDVYPRSIP